MGWLILIAAAVAGAVFWARSRSEKNDGREFSFQSYGKGNAEVFDSDEPVHAKPGTYDTSVFSHPETGKFTFPKYKRDSRFLVQIKDLTNYREELWDGLDLEEKREYDFKSFEYDLSSVCFEFEVDPFETFFKRLKKEDLEPYSFLRNKPDIIEELANCLDDDDLEFHADEESEGKLLQAGLVEEVLEPVNTEDEKRQHLKGQTKDELKPLCKAAGVAVSQRKSDIIDQLLDAEIEIEPVVWLKPTQAARAFIQSLSRWYVDELKGNLERFHPGYVEPVITEAMEQAGQDGMPQLENLLSEEIETQYWRSRYL